MALTKMLFSAECYWAPMVKWIDKMFTHAMNKKWYETYWAFDLHGVVIKPNFKRGETNFEYYPYAKECLQLITKRDDIIMFTFTSSYPEELEVYKKRFIADDIIFNYFNENPEISESSGAFGYYAKKPYYNVLFDDKATFFPETDWESVYKCMLKWENCKPDINWKKI